MCSGEDKLTREDSKSVALDPEAFVNATRGRGVLQSIGGRRLAHANLIIRGYTRFPERFPTVASWSILKGSKTEQNLKDASAGKSQANRCYLFFAKHADIEGYPEIAGLFRDTAEGKSI